MTSDKCVLIGLITWLMNLGTAVTITFGHFNQVVFAAMQMAVEVTPRDSTFGTVGSFRTPRELIEPWLNVSVLYFPVEVQLRTKEGVYSF